MPDIEADDILVKDLFSTQYVFSVPIYQRPLSWETGNFDQLFEDIYDAMMSEEDIAHFLGSIILQDQDVQQNLYDVVDGQQRLTALAILMAVIRDATEDPELKTSLSQSLCQKEDRWKGFPAVGRIVPWQDLEEIFARYIYETGGTTDFLEQLRNGSIKYQDKQDPIYHLYEAITLYGEKIAEKLSDRGRLDSFVKYLFNRVYLVYIRTGSLTSAFRLFNVLNTRGLRLGAADIIKSENLGVISDRDSQKRYASIWRDIETNLGRDELDRVIGYIRTIQTKEKAKMSIYEEYKEKVFGPGKLKLGKSFIEYLREIGNLYNGKILEGEISAKRERAAEYYHVVHLMLNYVPYSDWIPPLLAFHHELGQDEWALPFLRHLERKLVVEWAARLTPTKRITSFNRIIRLIEKERDSKAVVNKMLMYWEEGGGDSAAGLSFSDRKPIRARLREALTDEELYSVYGGKLARYVLLRLDMDFWELENFPGYQGTVTVEHILPQHPSEDSEWARLFSEDDREKWTNRLGNLVLLSGRKNSKARNFEFQKKKEAYFKGKSTSFKITQELEQVSNWTPKELASRHKRLLEAAESLWLDY